MCLRVLSQTETGEEQILRDQSRVLSRRKGRLLTRRTILKSYLFYPTVMLLPPWVTDKLDTVRGTRTDMHRCGRHTWAHTHISRQYAAHAGAHARARAQALGSTQKQLGDTQQHLLAQVTVSLDMCVCVCVCVYTAA